MVMLQKVLTRAVLVVFGSFSGILLLLLFNFSLSFHFAEPLVISNCDNERQNVAKSTEKPYDLRHWRQVWHDCGHTTCQPLINPISNFTASNDSLSIAPWPRNATAILCNEFGEWIFTESDAYGFRENALADYESTEITLIGDSFTQGLCVKKEDSIAGLLSKQHSHVLNLGVNGQQPLGELAVLKEYLPPSQTLIWLFFEGNDYNIFEKNWSFLKKYLNKGFSQGEKHHLAQTENAFLEKLKTERNVSVPPRKNSHTLPDFVINVFGPLRSFVDHLKGGTHGVKTYRFDEELFSSILRESHRFAADKGVTKFIFAYLPTSERYAWQPPKHANRKTYDEFKASVTKIASQSGWRVADIAERFLSVDAARLFPLRICGSHYTPEGYRLIVDELEAAIHSTEFSSRRF